MQDLVKLVKMWNRLRPEEQNRLRDDVGQLAALHGQMQDWATDRNRHYQMYDPGDTSAIIIE